MAMQRKNAKISERDNYALWPAHLYVLNRRAPRAAMMWSYWKTLGIRHLLRSEAMQQICALTGLTEQRAWQIVQREGMGLLWWPTGEFIDLRSENSLRRLSYRMAGVYKRSYMLVPLEAYKGHLGVIRALMSFPVASRSLTQPTAAAYTAKCLGRGRRAVTCYRNTLREMGYIKTTPVYERAAKDSEGAFQRGNAWYVRKPDLVLQNIAYALVPKIHRAKKTVLRTVYLTLAGREETSNLNRVGFFQELAYKLEDLSLDIKSLSPDRSLVPLHRRLTRLVSPSKLRPLVMRHAERWEFIQLLEKEAGRLNLLAVRLQMRPQHFLPERKPLLPSRRRL